MDAWESKWGERVVTGVRGTGGAEEGGRSSAECERAR